jgi:hypothetical protein
MTDPRVPFHAAVSKSAPVDRDAVETRARKLVRRRRVGVAAVGVATVVIAAGAASSALRPGEEVLTPADVATSPEPSASTSQSTSTDAPTASETAHEQQAAADLIGKLTDFARSPSQAAWEKLPFAETVQLGLGERIVKSVPAAELADPASWTLPVDMYAGYKGPFSALEQLAQNNERNISVGEHPHCAGSPRPAPDGLEALSRWSTQPAVQECLRWYSVDLFVEDGTIRAVTLDLWEP